MCFAGCNILLVWHAAVNPGPGTRCNLRKAAQASGHLEEACALVLVPAVPSRLVQFEAALVMDGGASLSFWAAARPEASEVVEESGPSGEHTNCYNINQPPMNGKRDLDRVRSSNPGKQGCLADRSVCAMSGRCRPGYPEDLLLPLDASGTAARLTSGRVHRRVELVPTPHRCLRGLPNAGPTCRAGTLQLTPCCARCRPDRCGGL